MCYSMDKLWKTTYHMIQFLSVSRKHNSIEARCRLRLSELRREEYTLAIGKMYVQASFWKHFKLAVVMVEHICEHTHTYILVVVSRLYLNRAVFEKKNKNLVLGVIMHTCNSRLSQVWGQPGPQARLNLYRGGGIFLKEIRILNQSCHFLL